MDLNFRKSGCHFIVEINENITHEPIFLTIKFWDENEFSEKIIPPSNVQKIGGNFNYQFEIFNSEQNNLFEVRIESRSIDCLPVNITHEKVITNFLNDHDFETNFMHSTDRPDCLMLTAFISKNAAYSTTLSDCYKCSAAVVFGYSACEVGDVAMAFDAIKLVESSLAVADEVPVHSHPRKNGVHLWASLVCVLCHLYLIVGYTRNLLILSRDVFYRSVNASSYQTYSYPASRTALIIGIVFLIKNKSSLAVIFFDLCFFLFKKAAAESDKNWILFSELKDIHNAANCAVRGLNYIECGEYDMSLFIQDCVSAFSRVSITTTEVIKNNIAKCVEDEFIFELDYLLPRDFSSEIYLDINEDVKSDQIEASFHFLSFGAFEGRKYKK